MQYKKLWMGLGLVMGFSFTVPGVVGYKPINNAPPIPQQVVTADGQLLFTGETICDGQSVWQSTGGQEVGTIWGHGWSRSTRTARCCIVIAKRRTQQKGRISFTEAVSGE